METHKKEKKGVVRKKGRNTNSRTWTKNLPSVFIRMQVNNHGHTKSGQCPYNIVDNNADL